MSEWIFENFWIIPVVMFAVFIIFVVIMIKSGPKIFKRITKTSIDLNKQILDTYGDDMEEIAKRKARLEAYGTKEKAKAVKQVIKGEVVDETTYDTCNHCGGEIDKNAKFCKHCGKETKKKKKTCKHCGAVLDNDSKFCDECGKEQK